MPPKICDLYSPELTGAIQLTDHVVLEEKFPKEGNAVFIEPDVDQTSQIIPKTFDQSIFSEINYDFIVDLHKFRIQLELERINTSLISADGISQEFIFKAEEKRKIIEEEEKVRSVGGEMESALEERKSIEIPRYIFKAYIVECSYVRCMAKIELNM